MGTPSWFIPRFTRPAAPLADWDHPAWSAVPALELGWWHASSAHRPRVRMRLAHHDGWLCWLTRVEDRGVRSRQRGWQAPVWFDSCTELFLEPRPGAGYSNLEINAGGAALSYWITDWRRKGEVFERYLHRPDAEFAELRIATSLPAGAEPALTGPTTWTVEAHIPESFYVRHAGEAGRFRGSWRGNCYQCGDETPHPRWGAWAPVEGELNFHRPECFGTFTFA